METSDRKQFGALIGAMLEAFAQEATQQRLSGYWVGLCDIPYPVVRTAVTEALRSRRTVPTVADLRELIAGGSDADVAVVAWNEAEKGARVSYMADLDFEDRAINATIRSLGGRQAFYDRMNAGRDSEMWLRKDFLKAYPVMLRRIGSLPDEELAVLLGEADRGVVNGRACEPRRKLIATIDKRPVPAIAQRPRDAGRIVDRRASSDLRTLGIEAKVKEA